MAKKLTQEEWIVKAKSIHGDKYDYSKVNYLGSLNKVTIICKIHGSFEQLPTEHVAGKGCKKCGIEKQSKRQRKSKIEWIKKCNEVHKNKNNYNYKNSNYTGSHNYVNIECVKHGVFKMKAAAHTQGQGCTECAKENLSRQFSKSLDAFIKDASIIHFNKYSYNNVVYVNGKTKVIITCPIHGDFEQTPNSHLNQKSGCPKCISCGFNPAKPAYLYYLKVTTDNGQILYKLGITNRTVDERFNLTDLSKIEIIKQKLYKNGQDALDWETKLKQKYKEYQYKGPNVLSSGNTELFTEDIVAMWYG